MITRKEIDFSKPLTEAQKKMLEEMNANPAIPDDDCPEFTVAEMVRMILDANQNGNAMDAFNDIKAGLEQAIQYEKGKLNAKTSTLSILPDESFTPGEIKSIRESPD